MCILPVHSLPQVEGGYLVTGSADCVSRCWVCELGDCCKVYRGHKKEVNCIALAKNCGEHSVSGYCVY